MIRTALLLVRDLVRFVALTCSSHTSLAAENLFLRKQLAFYVERNVRPRRLDDAARIALVALARVIDWRHLLTIVRPDTLVRWHRQGFRLFWRWKSRRPGRPRIPQYLQHVIATMARANQTWGEERIAAELLLKLGLSISPRTVRRYMRRPIPSRPRSSSQTWRTFVRNHARGTLACDFFVVVTATFRVVYVFLVLNIGTRRILHWNVTEHPTAEWTVQQFRSVLTGEEPYRFIVHDRDAVFSSAVDDALRAMNLRVLKTPVRVPQANAFCERLIGRARRECLDHVIPLNERQLRKILAEWVPPWSNTSITITIPPGATSGPLAVAVAPGMNNSNPLTFTVLTLPAPWLNQDIGSVGVAGSVSYASGAFTVRASGQQIWNTADGLHYVYQSLTGDGTIVARVNTLTGGASSQSAGVMIRETLDANSKHAYVAFSQSQIYFTNRTTTGGSTAAQTLTGKTLPYWVKLTRSGSTFTAAASADGVTWVQVGTPRTINMTASVYVALAVSSGQNSTLATATFDNVSLTPGEPSTPGSLPTGWLNQDVGSVGVAGSASYTGGIFTVRGAGQQIWNTADGLHLAYQFLAGDGTIVARVGSLTGGASSQSAGVMIRETLTANSKHAYVAFSQSQIYFTNRATTGGTTSAQSLTGKTLPYWVKLTRSGNTFTAAASPDGVNWVQVGTPRTITMTGTVYVGLAVSSGQNSTLATAIFDNVSISMP